jgi:uncharacterized protein (TIGR03437 family)
MTWQPRRAVFIGGVLGACGIAVLVLHNPVRAQGPQRLQIKSFSVGPDTTVSYPNTKIPALPDEHTSFLPPTSSGGPYLVFGAATAGPGDPWGAAVLQTTDFANFTFPAGYNFPLLASPLLFGQCTPPADNTTFDENYAAPGSVVQDPTLPPGNLIMLYEAENHCPGGVYQFPFYTTTGFARSSDNGKTWPAPVIGELGGPSRHPILQPPELQPTGPHSYIGDAIPSGFVDKTANGDYYLYVSYAHYFVATAGASPQIGVARAKLGADPLNFQKWYIGAFSEPGIGGMDGSAIPSGCNGRSQFHSEISYNDDLGMYLLIFLCQNGLAGAGTAAWYYSTASSLDLQDWTAPQMILNTQNPVTVCPDGNGGSYDGYYPSSVSPGAAAGHTKLTGYFFFLSGCGVPGNRQFLSRAFTITTQPQTAPTLTSGTLANGATYVAGGLVPGSWALVKGLNIANVTRIWQAFDFNGLGSNLPTDLSGTEVKVNGLSAAVYYVSPTQVSFQVPAGITGTASVQVYNNGAGSNTLTAPAAVNAPGIFPNIVNKTNYPVAVFLDGEYVGNPSISTAYRNAKPGDSVVMFATGLVPVPAGILPVARTVSGVTVTIGTVTFPADFAGLTFVGEFQINFTVPQQFAMMAAGNYPLSIQVNGVSSPVTINSSPPGQLVIPVQP